MAEIVWHPIYPGADIELAMVGPHAVGRICTRPGDCGWMNHLPNEYSSPYSHWKKTKTADAAREAMTEHVRRWFEQIEAHHG